MSTRNPGGEPPTGTREWASSNVNIQAGCEHDCRYCYAKAMAVRFGRATPGSWAQPVIDPKRAGKGYARRRGRIMFPSSHGSRLKAEVGAARSQVGRPRRRFLGPSSRRPGPSA